MTDTTGNQIAFWDFSVTPAAKQGTFKSFTDPEGNVTSVTSYTSGKPQEIQRSNGSLIDSELYSYVASGANAGLVSSVVLRRSTNGGGTWTTIRQVQYTYYSGEAHGNTGDLKLAQVQDGSGNTLDTTYYRYYTGESGGYTHGLKYVFKPQSYARLVAAQGSNIDSISDTNAAPYADDYYEYDSSQRATKHTVQGAGCPSCGNGLGAYTYSYTTSSNTNGYNSWQTKTVETLPDSNQNIVYTNHNGEVMLSVYQDATTGAKWDTYYKYDGSGRVIEQANPSAVSSYDDTQANLGVTLNTSSGLITDIDYGTSTTATGTTAGDVVGYAKDTKIQQGSSGATILQSSMQYFSQTAGSTTIYPTATQTVYRNTDGTGAETTSYSYTFFTNSVQVQSVTVTKPVITSAENGPGVADTETTFNDI